MEHYLSFAGIYIRLFNIPLLHKVPSRGAHYWGIKTDEPLQCNVVCPALRWDAKLFQSFLVSQGVGNDQGLRSIK